MNFRTGSNAIKNKKKKKTAVVTLSAASLVLLAGVLVVASSIAPAGNAQAASKGIAQNKYMEYVNHVHGGYKFLEKHTWHYNSTRSEADNLNAFKAWWCTDDSGKPIGSDKCKDMPAGDVKAFMQFVEKSRDKLLFDRVVQLQDEMGQHHSVKQWFIQAYNNGKPSQSATTDHTESEMKAMVQEAGNKL
ncbi:hypothetical protein NTE_03249 [Candidatus Nitrososphaera evergladensis SR1]|jgi:hypothetical protein|uniref:Uncharacterized protein n=1 Tax=Candidatus Nitrososphaera evergladensis SR1 TaxID=1459636 RepID=A0A075MVW7_9ARCH|nr:hypothetical protein NTE_03249 [Candidatus Nitrososphaera evergladensis SR1]